MRSSFLVAAVCVAMMTRTGPLAAQASATLVGVWERVSQQDSTGATVQPPGPSAFAIYSSNGYFSQVAIPTGRPKINKRLADMSKEEILSVFRDVIAWRGTYSVSANRLTRTAIAHTNPRTEGTELVQLFRIAGDTLVLSDPNPANKAEARFVRVK